MSLTRDEMERLAFAKYLLSLAARQILLNEPLASVGLLLLHDATEHLLVVCCDHIDAMAPKNTPFMGYWDVIEKKMVR